VAAAASAPLVMLKVLGEMVGASVVATESVLGTPANFAREVENR
jgi:hypothetical protein